MDYALLKARMVEVQLIPRGISDKKVLNAFRKVDRHEFVPTELKKSAYEDYPLPVGEGQTISQPFMVALMTQCLGLNGGEKILEIGTGSGYQTAILASIAKEVLSVERIDTLAKNAEGTLRKLKFNNVKIKTGDGTLGWKEHAPYNGIIVTAGAPSVPKNLLEQLEIGGKLVIPVGSMFSQVLTVVERIERGFNTTEVSGCVFVPLIGKNGWKNHG